MKMNRMQLRSLLEGMTWPGKWVSAKRDLQRVMKKYGYQIGRNRPGGIDIVDFYATDGGFVAEVTLKVRDAESVAQDLAAMGYEIISVDESFDSGTSQIEFTKLDAR